MKKNIYKLLSEDSTVNDRESLSVEEVLNLSMLKGCEILGGRNGLCNRCRHMLILETPEGLNWLEGGEFLITSGYAFNGRDDLKKSMIEEAHSKGASAIAIKDRRYFGEINEKLISDADTYCIPLIKIPYDIVYTKMVSAFYYLLFFRKNEYILNLNIIYEKLLNLSFADKDIDEIICSLSDFSNSNVFLYDHLFNLKCKSIINNDYDDVSYLISIEGQSLTGNPRIVCINRKVNNSYVSIYSILKKNKIIAFVFVVKNRQTDVLEQRAIEFGVSIISSRMEKDMFLEFNKYKYKKTLIDVLLNNKELPDEFYINAEKDLGWDRDGYIIGLCLKCVFSDEFTIDDFNKIVNEEVSKFKDYDNFIVTQMNNSIFVFLKLEPDELFPEIITSIFNNINLSKDNLLVSVGASNMYKVLNDIEKMYNEAHLAVLFSNYDIIYFNSLDTIKLLYPLKNDDEIQRYYEKTIKKLEVYDVIHGTNMLETIEAYFRYNMNNKVTASKLFIHVETLRYRLNRITEITGCSTIDSEGLFALHMGIKLIRLLRLK